MPADTRVRLSFLGGASAIGASSTLVEVGDTSVLVDCGVRFKTGRALPDLDALSGKRLDAVVLTHAHSDHSGALPVVHAAFPGVPVYMTPPTADLVSILQRDALKLMDIAAEREGEFPLYTERQVEAALAAIRPLHHGQSLAVGDLELTLLPASHILGASMLHLATPAGDVLFTGDYSVSAQRTVPALGRPALPVDLLVTESTYGNRLHSDRKAAEARMIARILQVLEGQGRILIPAFAIGRAQEVLRILKAAMRDGKLPAVPVFVDGMVRSVCDVYSSHERYVSSALAREIRAAGHPFYSEPVRRIRSAAERKEALDAGPCVFVASSGMLAGGPSAFYASALAACERDAIHITGYQDEESPGRALLRLAEQTGPRELRLGERVVEVRCAFETYSLSAHADRMQMAGLAEALRPRTVVLVHGDREAKEGLYESLGRSCKDIEMAEDGMQIARSHPPRRRQERRPLQAPALSPEAAAALIGPATGKPLELAQLAEAWYGTEVDAAALERFAQEIESTGLVRRDDERRQILWPQTPEARTLEPTDEERALAEQLKLENPKGRLLELCMQRRMPAPQRFETSQDGRFVAEFQADVDGERLSGGIHRAATKKLAEQLAARGLLEELQRRAAPAVPAKTAAGGGEDPRMRLNELRQQGMIEGFGYETLQQRGPTHLPVFVMTAWAQAPGGDRETIEPVEAGSKKEAQHAAATRLLAHIQRLGWC